MFFLFLRTVSQLLTAKYLVKAAANFDYSLSEYLEKIEEKINFSWYE